MPEAEFDACVRTSFATLGITVTQNYVTGLRLLPTSVLPKVPKKNSIAHLACIQLQAYLDNPSFVFDVPIKLTGTHHRLTVWEEMRRIPAGKTLTYGELATAIHSSARAVGGACGANPIPVIVPCHRIIAAGGDIGGFMGARGNEGFEIGIKRWLLEHEGAF